MKNSIFHPIWHLTQPIVRRLRTPAWVIQRQKERRFREDFERFRVSQTEAPNAPPIRWEDRMMCLDDATSTIEFDRHYIYHTAWAARYLAAARPQRHVDIGSSLYFVAIASAFVPIEHYDFRRPQLGLTNVAVGSANLLNLSLPSESISSLSCMHVIEHIGLGRYGDPIDARADHRAMAELARVLAAGGVLLIVVPVGRRKVVFNAHRVYAFNDIVEGFSGCRLEEFALIPDDSADGDLILGASPEYADRQFYGCGCFLFRKPRLAL